ncbi:MAG TPA: hypothetical protein VGO96_17585 [Pyrinomonadaceae bacterium]|jgi:hypothetical protein|nr:hypothetical protein [Pyrinomonadaceae bacterium]
MRFKLFVVALLVLSLNVQAQQTRPSRRAERRSIANAAAIVADAPPARVQDVRDTSQRGSVAGQSLPIRRVILYSNGVAYIERRGMVSGHAEVNLSFKQSQVDDVLKSMIVLDLGQGRIGAVSYNSSAPPSARIADIPFSVASATQSSGLAGVLGQLQGARVVVTTANRTATGSILTVEERRSQIDADKPALVTHALVIASENGELSSFELAEVRSVKLIDEGTRRDIAEFASATAAARRRDAKTIVVTSDGEGQREMLVSYTVAAPIWKTTYRVVLDAAGKPFFQGWAIVDNVSEEDWNAVQLSLISGTPVSFIQPIQQPFYRYRPVIPMPGNLSLNPQVYEPDEGVGVGGGSGGSGMGGAPIPTQSADEPPPPPSPRSKLQASMRARGARSEAEQKQDLLLRQQANSVNNLNLLVDGTSTDTGQGSLSAAITGESSGIAAAAEGSEVGDLFEYQIAQPVTVKRDRSALIPILQTRMEGARVSIFNEAIRRERPMSGMLLKNTSTLTLEDGAMTIIDGNAYAGEALMERLKPAEQRLISFALDLGTLVNVRMKEDRAPAYLVRILNGVFQAHYHRQDKKTYSLANQTDHTRILYVEHPVRPGWELDEKETPKPEGRSARYYRFRVELKPHERAELTVTERQPLIDTFALTNVTSDQLTLFVSRKYIDDATRAALQKIVEIKSRIAEIDARLQAIDTEITEIGEDQTRLRENIETLSQTAEAKQLIARYVAKADQQETRIEQLTKERQTANEERGRLQPQLDAAIRALSYNRDLTELTKQGTRNEG